VAKDFKIYNAVGCKKCDMTGYTGRIALFEILEMTPQLAEIIIKEPSETRIFQEAQRQGMVTMRQDGVLKVLAGITTVEELLRVAEENQ